MIDSIGRLAEDNTYDLTITLEEIEEIAYADGERVIRDLAQTGKYEIIIAHSTYSDAVAAVRDDYPDTLFAYSGSGNDGLGGNGYWIDVFIHEPAYLAGIIAGMMTETNKISGVAAFPFPNVTAPLHAFIDGAQSVNPDITAEVAYIESWFDPATAQEAAAAQIAAGVRHGLRGAVRALRRRRRGGRCVGLRTLHRPAGDVGCGAHTARWLAGIPHSST